MPTRRLLIVRPARAAFLVAFFVALLAASALVACDRDDDAPSASATGGAAVASPMMTMAPAATTAAGTPSAAPTAAPAGTPPSSATAPPAATLAPPVATGTPPSGTGERVASTFGIATADLPRVRFTTSSGGTVSLPVEVPPESEYSIGLSGRRSLQDRGMLFYFPKTTDVQFWMLDTHIDLDIAFIDGAMRVIRVSTMLADTRDLHGPGAPYIAAVEAPAGWYARNGVPTGATATFEFDVHAATGR